MMEKSKLPLQTWFMCIHLMTTTKKPFSCLELQRQLGVKKYETVHLMMSKIRLSMGKREERHQLSGVIEVDDCYIEVVDLPEIPEFDSLGNVIDTEKLLGNKDEFIQKRGVGSQGKQKVLVMVESTPRPETDGYRIKREMGYLKMVVVDQLTNISVNYEVQKHINYDSHVITDKGVGLTRIGEVVRLHTSEVMKGKDGSEKLPWVHKVISNCKRQLLGTHHSVSRTYLQNYLNEFCYKINRRNFVTDMFDRMLICGVGDTWY